MAAFNSGDAAGVAAIYTEDGQIMPPNAPMTEGKSNVQQTIQGFLDAGVKGLTLESVEIERFGNTANEIGKYTLYADGDTEIDNGKYIVIWKNIDGEWKYYRDIFNSNLPIPQPEPEAESDEETSEES